MKTRILLATIMAFPVLAFSQPGEQMQVGKSLGGDPRPEVKVQRLDSVVYILRDGQTGQDFSDYVFTYNYGRGMDYPREVLKYSLPERALMNRQLYTYNRDVFKTRYLYQELADGIWADRMLVEYTPDAEGRTEQELYSNPGSNGAWQPYQRHMYTYDQYGRTALYLRSMNDATRGWYDFSENIWTYGEGNKLLRRVEQRVADDWVIWTETYYYGAGAKPVERIRQTMRYDPVSRTNRLTNDSRHLYYYDEFNDPVVAEQYRWLNGEWSYVGKSLYYYSFIPGQRVTLCHKGITISVTPREVRVHLAHGDYLGLCEYTGGDGGTYPLREQGMPPKYGKVFPNPASDHFELTLEPGHKFSSAELFSAGGRVVMSQDISSCERVIFGTGGLKSGQYILKISSGALSEETIVIIR